MSFTYKQLSASRWGIYTGSRLLATVSDRETCETIVANFLASRKSSSQPQTNSPDPNKPDPNKPDPNKTDPNKTALTQYRSSHSSVSSQISSGLPNQTTPSQTTKQIKPGITKPQSAHQMSDAELARVLNLKSLKVKELERAVIQAQSGQRNAQ